MNKKILEAIDLVFSDIQDNIENEFCEGNVKYNEIVMRINDLTCFILKKVLKKLNSNKKKKIQFA